MLANTVKQRRELYAVFSVSLLACFLLILPVMTGCKKELDFDKAKSLDWNPDFAIPLVHDSITLEKILTQHGNGDHLVIDETGNISILYYYNNDAFRLSPNGIIKLSTGSYTLRHPITQAEQVAIRTGDLDLPPLTLDFNLIGDPPDARVDSMRIKKGTLRIKTNHTFSNNGYLIIRFPDARKNGVVYADTIHPYVNGPFETNLAITDVLFDLRSSPNTIHAQVEGRLNQSLSINAGDQVNAEFSLSVDSIGSFAGFLGHQTFNQLKDTIKVNVFNNAYILGELYFIDPQITISIVNSIGVPTELTVEKLVAINYASVSSLDVADRLGPGRVFPVPSPPFPTPGPAMKTVAYTNENTGNAMHDFFNMKPDQAAFQVKTILNPIGTPVNFFTDTSSFYADLRVKLPMWGHFDHLTYQDTFDLVIDKPEEFEYLEFRTHIINGMPATSQMQVYFTDDQYNKIDSLAGADQILIREAPVDPSTYLPYPGMYGTKDTTYILDMQRMQKFEHVTKMLVKAVLFTPNMGQDDVKFKGNQSIRLDFTARAKLRKEIRPWKSSNGIK